MGDEECQICFEETSQEDFLLLPCNHQFCRTCMAKYFERQMEQIALVKARVFTCPYCRQPIPGDIVGDIVGKPSLTTWTHEHSLWSRTKKIPFEYYNDLRTYIWMLQNTYPCPHCAAPTSRFEYRRQIRCTNCNREWCWSCGNNYHPANNCVYLPSYIAEQTFTLTIFTLAATSILSIVTSVVMYMKWEALLSGSLWSIVTVPSTIYHLLPPFPPNPTVDTVMLPFRFLGNCLDSVISPLLALILFVCNVMFGFLMLIVHTVGDNNVAFVHFILDCIWSGLGFLGTTLSDGCSFLLTSLGVIQDSVGEGVGL
eukprot:TRINITY_DN6145_c0_g1_i1.p1 TRINITY_DN6145_c0_g1~~TRINITY_DN6145_c0_g1_i1.p1  ORF type:complete len:312 (+),score=6.58 TRINITY_DN6145_c0_g1_i1:38-973(+)